MGDNGPTRTKLYVDWFNYVSTYAQLCFVSKGYFVAMTEITNYVNLREKIERLLYQSLSLNFLKESRTDCLKLGLTDHLERSDVPETKKIDLTPARYQTQYPS